MLRDTGPHSVEEGCDNYVSVGGGLSYRRFSKVDAASWQESIEGIYRRMRLAVRGGPYRLNCDGVTVRVLPNVYAPRFFTDSLWFAREVPKIVGRGSMLEIGTGTGIIAIACARNGANVVATDVNPDAVANARINFEDHGLAIEVREGEGYKPLAQRERFDFIFWAHPFNNWPSYVPDMLLRSGRDYRYEGVRHYIAHAKDHLTPRGRLLLGTGDTADIRSVLDIARTEGYEPKRLADEVMPLEEGGQLLVRYFVSEFVPLRD